MASRATLIRASRFLTSFSTTGPLRLPTFTRQTRKISSYPGLLGVSKLQPVVDLHNPEEVNSLLGYYEEAFERWQNEAQTMRDIRLLPEDLAFAAKIEGASQDQIKDLLEAISTDDVLDIRRGWVVTANY